MVGCHSQCGKGLNWYFGQIGPLVACQSCGNSDPLRGRRQLAQRILLLNMFEALRNLEDARNDSFLLTASSASERRTGGLPFRPAHAGLRA